MLPEIRNIKRTTEIKIGDTLVHVKYEDEKEYPDGIRPTWEMKTKEDIIHASIAIIEYGEKWRPLAKNSA